MKTGITLAAVLLSVLFHFSAYAQLDVRPPGLYAVVGEMSIPLKYTRGTVSVESVKLDVARRVYVFDGVTSGVEASDNFVLVLDPKRKMKNRMLTADDIFFKSMEPRNMLVLPLAVDKEYSQRVYDGGFDATSLLMDVDPKMEFDWEQISDNSFEIRVPGLIPGEYGFVTRMSPLSRFEIHSVFGFAVPGIAELDEIAGRYVDAATRISPFEAISMTDEEKMAKPDFLLDISAVDTLASDEQKINSLGFLLADYGVRTLFEMPTEEYRDVIKDLAREADYTVREYVARRRDYVLSDIFREHYEEYKVGYGVAVFWMIQSALLNETAYIIASDPDLFLNRISDEQADAFLTLLKCRDESLTILGRRNDYMKSILSSTRLPMDDTIEKSKDYFITCRDSIISVRNSMLK